MYRSLLLLGALVALTSAGSAQMLFDNVHHGGGARTHRFDLLHSAIDVRFDDPGKTVIGSVRHRFRSLDPALASIRLDAAEGMKIEGLKVDNATAQFRHHGDTLTILLPAQRRYNDTFEVAIDYRVTPKSGIHFIQPDSLTPGRRSQIWTQGEAEEHHHWIPTYDSPNDRAITELRVGVPGNWKVLSNGALVGTPQVGSDGRATWHYRMDKPHSTYLIMLAAGEYMVTHDTAAGVPLEYWTYPEHPERVAPTFGRTPDMMKYFIDLLGPYPWNKYAQVFIADFMYGGMENTTAVTLNDYAFVDERGLLDYNPDGLIAHEMAHMWFGDLVTNRSWGHLWIHESYATYLAGLYLGHHYGPDALAKEMYDNAQTGIRTDERQGRDPIVNGKGVTANLYDRGSVVLGMLKELVGEESFWRASRLFLERHAYGLVETHDLETAFEDASGLDLGWFFNQWVYKAGYPAFKVEKSYAKDTLKLRVRQTQKLDSLTGLFQMPVPVELHLASSVVADTIWVSKADETFTFPVRERPRFVIFDAGDAILKSMEYRRPENELVAQLGASRSIDRLLAVKELVSADSMKGKNAAQSRSIALRDAFLKESAAFVREEIVNRAAMMEVPRATEVIMKGLTDPDADVRRGAVENTFIIADKKQRAALLRPLLADSSYNVVSATLGMLSVTDTQGLEPILRRMKGIRGRRDRLAQAWLNTVASGGYVSLANDVVDYTRPPYNGETRSQAYFALSKLPSTTPAVRTAIERGLADSSSSIRSSAASAARKHLDAEMRRMIESLRDRLTGEPKETVEAVLKK